MGGYEGGAENESMAMSSLKCNYGKEQNIQLSSAHLLSYCQNPFTSSSMDITVCPWSEFTRF